MFKMASSACVFFVVLVFILCLLDGGVSRHVDSLQADGRKCRDDLCYHGDDVDNDIDPDLLDPFEESPYDDYGDYGDNDIYDVMAGGFECPYGYRKVNRHGVYFCEPLSEEEMPVLPKDPECSEGQDLIQTETGQLCIPRNVAPLETNICPSGLVPKANGEHVECVSPEDFLNPDCPPGYSPEFNQIGQRTNCIPLTTGSTPPSDTRFGPDLHGTSSSLPKKNPNFDKTTEKTTISTKQEPTKSHGNFKEPFNIPSKEVTNIGPPDCGPGEVAAMSTDGMICMEPVFPTAVCPPDQVPVLTDKTLTCVPCPYGQKVVTKDGGLMCEQFLVVTEAACPEGLMPIETAVGRICQYVPPPYVPLCPLGQRTTTVDGRALCIPEVVECPEGQITMETKDGGVVCGFIGTSPEKSETIECPNGMILIDSACTYPEPTPLCQEGELPVTSEDEPVTCQSELQHSEDIDTSSVGCHAGTILTQTDSGFLCEPTDLPSDRVPVCQPSHVIARLGEMYECISLVFANIVCNDDEILTRLGDDFKCMSTRESNPIECGPSEIIVLGANGRPQCLDLTLAADICGPGYTIVSDYENPAGFVCRKKDLKPQCPPGFELKLTGGKPACVSSSSPTCVDDYGATVECHGNLEITSDLDPALCEVGYRPDLQDSRVVCVLEASYVEPDTDDIIGHEVLKPCTGEHCLTMEHFESPKWSPDFGRPDIDAVFDNGEPCIPGYPCHGVDLPVGEDHIPDLVHEDDSHAKTSLQPCTSDDDDIRPCDLDLDILLAGCNPDCANGGTCVNGSCVCPSGITGTACQEDVDECTNLPRNTCSYQCENTFGSFRCTCPPDHVLAEDQVSCERVGCIPDCLNGGSCDHGNCRCPDGFKGKYCQTDIDECEMNGGRICQYQCRNTYGGYQCICPPGSRLAPDRRTCINTTCIPECRNGGNCENSRCKCPTGYYGIICQFDVNECRTQDLCDQICQNTRGSFVCSCRDGYTLNADRRTCSRR